MAIIGPEITPRLRREAQRWMRSTRPPDIPAPGPGQESVWDYPRPPRIETIDDRVQIVHGGEVIARTQRALRVAETAHPPTYYIHPDDVDQASIIPASGSSYCDWLGRAEYVSVHAGKDLVERGGWRYPRPHPEYEVLAGYLAFYAQKLDTCMVGDLVVESRPGAFYAGWVTPNLIGPFEGEVGARGW